MMTARHLRKGLAGLAILTEVGCAAGRAGYPPTPVRPVEAATLPPGVIQVVAGSGLGLPRVTRAGFAETWKAELATCSRDTLLTIVLGGPALLAPILVPFVVPVCGAMTAALPGMTSRFAARSMRAAAEQRLRDPEVSARVRDRVAAALESAGREAVGPAAAVPVEPGGPGDLGSLGVTAVLEVSPSEVRIADDGTLRGLAVRARLVRVTDGVVLVDRRFTDQPATPLAWPVGLDGAVETLAGEVAGALLRGGQAYRSFPE